MWDLGLDESSALYVASTLDVDGSGLVDFNEFTAACCSLSEQRAKELFGWVIDKVGEDNLSLGEVGKMVQEAALDPIHAAEIKEWLKQATKHLEDLDGSIT